MAKYIYKAVGLIVIFVAALFFFGRQMETSTEVASDVMTLEKETFPVMMIETQGHLINPLYGYAAKMQPNTIRESLTPLDQSKSFTLHMEEGEKKLTELEYSIIDKENGEVYDTEQIKGFADDQDEIPITISYPLATSTEYILDIGGVLSDGREVHYFTRLKAYLEDSGFDPKLDFIKDFHEKTFKKSKIEEVAKYLEPDPEARNSTLAKVNINSSSDLVTWAGMSPKVVSDEYLTVKEYNMETACVQYNYFVRANTNSGPENYQIKEFYRVRHSGGQNFLLAFERTMEAEYDPDMASIPNSQLKLGITSKTTGKLLSVKNGKGLYFSRSGCLYYYDMSANKINRIYKINSDDASYLQRAYNENDIRLVAVDDDDNLFFCVIGYQPRGEYEGDVGIILYRYSKGGKIEELVNLPMETSYKQLAIDFEDYSYVSPRDVFYFTVANTVYSYNISGRRLEILQKNVKDISFKTMVNSNCYVWSSSLSKGYGESVTIFNLANDEHRLIQSPSNDEYIRLLGTIESNVVYGYVKKDDISRLPDGTKIIPCYKLVIADTSGTVVKTYEKKGLYIKNAVGSGNVVNIRLCRKKGNRFKNAGEDSILNRSSIKASKFSYTSRLTNKSLTEWYIKFPSTFTMPGKIKQADGKETIQTNSNMVRLEQPSVMNYYVYAFGRITKSYENVRKAIKEADKQMGVVISGDHKVVWERSGAFNQNNLGDLSLVKKSSNVSNLAACASMVLSQASDRNFSSEILSASKDNLMEMLEECLDHPLNLKGCSLEQVIYFVSNNKPVIAMTYDDKAVVIAGYTKKQLVIYDPEVGKRTVNRAKFADFFKKAGNRYISYME